MLQVQAAWSNSRFYSPSASMDEQQIGNMCSEEELTELNDGAIQEQEASSSDKTETSKAFKILTITREAAILCAYNEYNMKSAG